MSGYLYILSNAAFPTLLKIGQTSDSPEQRIRQLNSTGVPFPFLLEACFRVENSKQAEAIVHKALEQHRSSQNREFFEVDLRYAIKVAFQSIIEPNLLDVPSTSEKKRAPPIPKEELQILQKIVSSGSAHGMAQWRLYENTRASQLEIEILLSKLEHKKFVKCDRRNSSYGTHWLPTTKGIKFLSDNNLIEKWMHESW